MEREKYIGARVTTAEYARIVALARATRRSVSQVVRELLRRAEVIPGADIRLRDPHERRSAA